MCKINSNFCRRSVRPAAASERDSDPAPDLERLELKPEPKRLNLF